MAQVVGVVSKLTGIAYVRLEGGNLRQLSLGDDVFEGEVLTTGSGAVIEISMPDAPPIVLAGDQELLLNGEVTVAGRNTSNESLLDEESLDLIIAALEGDGDLLESDALADLGATAAGGTGDEGSSFIRLNRIGYDLNDANTDDVAVNTGDIDVNEGDFLQLQPEVEFSVENGEVSEGGVITVVISRSGNTDVSATIDVSTLIPNPSIDSAEANDFVPVSTTVTFAAGETTQTIEIQTTQDFIYEGEESFRVELSNPTAEYGTPTTLLTPVGTISIVDDGTGPDPDQAGPAVPDDDSTVFSIDSTEAAREGGVITFTVTRSGDAAFEQTVDFATSIEAEDTASVDDFVAANGTLTFAQGETTKTFTIQTNADQIPEGNETFTVSLSNNSIGSRIGQGSSTGTILEENFGGGESSATVSEGGLGLDGINSETATGSFTYTAPDGPVNISIGNVQIVENGVLTGNQPATGDYGNLTVTDFDETTGTLTYSYTLTAAASTDPAANDGENTVSGAEQFVVERV